MSNYRKIKIGNNYYKVIITKHVLQRIMDRDINPENIIPTIINVGNRISNYHNNDIMVIDNSFGYSLLLHIDKIRITVITAIDKTSVFCKLNTVKIAV